MKVQNEKERKFFQEGRKRTRTLAFCLVQNHRRCMWFVRTSASVILSLPPFSTLLTLSFDTSAPPFLSLYFPHLPPRPCSACILSQIRMKERHEIQQEEKWSPVATCCLHLIFPSDVLFSISFFPSLQYPCHFFSYNLHVSTCSTIAIFLRPFTLKFHFKFRSRKNLSCRWSSSRIFPIDDQYVRRKSSKEEIKKMWCGWLGTTLWFTRKAPFFKILNCSHFDRYIPSFLSKYSQDFVGLECRRIEPESLLRNESEMNVCEWWCVLSVGVQKICWNYSKVLWTQLVVSQSPDQSIQRAVSSHNLS